MRAAARHVLKIYSPRAIGKVDPGSATPGYSKRHPAIIVHTGLLSCAKIPAPSEQFFQLFHQLVGQRGVVSVEITAAEPLGILMGSDCG